MLRLVAAHLVFLFTVTPSGCSQGRDYVELKNMQLDKAEARLIADPSDREALGIILDTLAHDRSPVVRANAASTLGTLAEKIAGNIKDESVPALIKVMEDDEEAVKYSAAYSLKQFGPLAKEAVPILRENLRPGDSGVAWHSAEAMGAMKGAAAEAAPDLIRVIQECQNGYPQNDDANICKFATKALGEIGPAANAVAPDLKRLLNHKNPYFRGHIAVALLRINPKDSDAINELDRLLKDHDVEIRRKTIWALEEAGRESYPARNLVEESYREDRDSSVRAAASRLLQLLCGG